MTSLCGRCNDPLPGDGELDASCCSLCKKKYHFACNTISEVSWRTYGPDRRGAWKCSYCKENSNKSTTGSSANTPKETPKSSTGNIPMTIEDLGKRFVEMETSLAGKLTDFEESLNFYGNIMDELAKSIKSIETKNLLIEKRLTTQEAENVELKTRVKELEGLLRQQEQREQATKLEISGLINPAVNENQTVQKLLELAQLQEENFQFKAEKIVKKPKEGQSGTSNTKIIVQFKTVETRNIVLSKIKSGKLYLKLSELIQGGEKIYCHEHLTQYYRKLLYEANKVKFDKKYSYLWVKNGKILLKKTADSNIESLICMNDLNKM